MSDIGPYGVTQNADAAMVTANALVGEMAGNVIASQVGDVSPAMFSTAPYKKPVHRDYELHIDDFGRKLCSGKDTTCRAWPMVGSDFCHMHQPGEGQ